MTETQLHIPMDRIANSPINIIADEDIGSEFHNLNDEWKLWAHLPHDTDWSINSYKHVFTFRTVEDTIAITESLPEVLVNNCMLFVMKTGIAPIWEDVCNRDGGCFSYKILNKNVYKVWKELTYTLAGGSISTNPEFVKNVTGITISPKKKFCIIKIWMTNCKFQNPATITSDVEWIVPQGCLFKKHTPEY
jgi:hypothetical protein